MRRTMIVLSAAAVTFLAAMVIGQPRELSVKPDRLVTGTVFADPPGDEKGILIAGFTISLRSGDTVVGQATTDEYGSYTFRNPTPGSYRLCWGGAAWKPGCHDEPVVVGDASVYIRPTRVDPNGRFLFGQVADGDEIQVEARTKSGTVVATVANALGQYVLAGLPDDQIEVTASGAESTTTRSAKPNSGGARMDLLVAPKQPVAPPNPPSAEVCPKLNFFFNCPPGTPGKCDNPRLALNRLSNDEAAAKTYYADVDPKNTRLTFAQWLKVAGFHKRGGGGTRGFYTNDNDLGFGRDMHILETKFGVFAYVTNYAECCTLQHPRNAKLARKAPKNKRIATVCMEWSTPAYNGAKDPGPDNDPKNRFVKFFVFGGDGARLLKADLDGNGPRFVPSLCINCHGGQEYTGSANVNASFLPFDLDGFKFDGAPRFRAFRALNQLVKSSRPNRDIVELIDGWYPPGGDDVPDLFRPATWNERENRKKVYDVVVARSCRTCHVAFTAAPTWSDWSDFQFGDIELFTANGLMPHAVITKMNMYSKERAHWPDEEGPRVLQCFVENALDETKMQECIDNP